jgi:hypothetical protein
MDRKRRVARVGKSKLAAAELRRSAARRTVRRGKEREGERVKREAAERPRYVAGEQATATVGSKSREDRPTVGRGKSVGVPEAGGGPGWVGEMGWDRTVSAARCG